MHEAMLRLLRIQGFRSLRKVELELGPLTLLIGPNGAGKSNIISALEMVSFIASRGLQRFVSERGGASFLMHQGPQQTPAIELYLEFHRGERGDNAYEARLTYGSDESLYFMVERAGFRPDAASPWRWSELGAGHRESALEETSQRGDTTARTVLHLLRKLNFYHFHDTSRRSPLRTRDYDNGSGLYLRSNGSNLPAFLLGLARSEQEDDQAAWRRVVGLIKRVAPFIAELRPEEDRQGARLEWVDRQGNLFGPAHLSDGTLRALALIAALTQPRRTLPLLSCIDEPELGLHPAALELIAGLIASAITSRQVLLSTQSPALLDLFEPEDVVVTEHSGAETKLRRLDAAALESDLALMHGSPSLRAGQLQEHHDHPHHP